MISSAQALTWLDGRDSSTITNFTGANGQYGFTLSAAVGASGLHAMLPMSDGDGTIQAFTYTGANVSYQTQTIKGIQYAVFDANPGSYQVTYSDYRPSSPQPTPTSSSPSTAVPNKKSVALGLSTSNSGQETSSSETPTQRQTPSSSGSNSSNTDAGSEGGVTQPSSGELPTWAKVIIGATAAVVAVGGGSAVIIRVRRPRL